MPMTPEQFAFHSSAVLASVADACMQTALRVTKQNDWLVRLNLVAYCDYRLCCAASREISGMRLQRFMDNSDADVIAKIFHGAEYAQVLLASRRAGYMDAEGDRSNKFAIAQYFRACCGSDKVVIDYDDIVMDPKDLRFTIENFGALPGAVAALSKAESMDDPVVYSIDPMGDSEMIATLFAAAKSVFDIWQGAIHD